MIPQHLLFPNNITSNQHKRNPKQDCPKEGTAEKMLGRPGKFQSFHGKPTSTKNDILKDNVNDPKNEGCYQRQWCQNSPQTIKKNKVKGKLVTMIYTNILRLHLLDRQGSLEQDFHENSSKNDASHKQHTHIATIRHKNIILVHNSHRCKRQCRLRNRIETGLPQGFNIEEALLWSVLVQLRVTQEERRIHVSVRDAQDDRGEAGKDEIVEGEHPSFKEGRSREHIEVGEPELSHVQGNVLVDTV